MNNRIILLGLALFFATLAVAQSSSAQTLEERVDQLEQDAGRWSAPVTNDADFSTLTLFLFGVFCALWAQNTGRNAWLWFLLGVFFNFIAALVLLYKNSNDRSRYAAPSD